MKNIFRNIAVATSTFAMLALAGVSPAQADEAHAKVDSSSVAVGEVNGTANVNAIQALGLTVKGKPVARYVRNPAKHWNPKQAMQVPFAKSYAAGVRSGKPFRLRKGMKFPDTYVGMAADLTEFDYAVKNKVKGRWQLFDFKNGQVRNRGFWTGKRWIGDCVNPKPGNRPTVTVNSLHITKVFKAFRVNVKGRLSLWATTSGMVEVNCGSSWAKASYSVRGEATVDGSIVVRAKTRSQAYAKGAQALKAKYSSSTEIMAALKADAMIKLEGAAEASCSGGTPPVVTPAPDVIEVDTINDVLVNNTRTITVTGTVADGHTANLYASAKNGGTITNNKTQSVSGGNFTVKVTYKAPSEVPGDNGDVAAGRDRVDFTLTQSDGQKDSLSTNQFEIRPAPVDPL